jgi:hypothetical protein
MWGKFGDRQGVMVVTGSLPLEDKGLLWVMLAMLCYEAK